MRVPEAAVLVSTTYAIDDYGVPRKAEVEKAVYGYYSSISASELFEGGRSGLNPEFRFTMTELDYGGEAVIIRDGQRYAIYRTYKPGNGTVELYAERKGGTNGSN